MSATFTIDLSKIEEAFDKIETVELTHQQWERMGAAAVALILARTEQGLNPYGLPFSRYAAATARDRARRGRRTDAVTLSDTGRMMGALTSGVIANSVRLTFVGAEQVMKAAFHQNGTRDMPAREFLSIYERTSYYNRLSEIAANMLAKNLEEKLRT